ncbi:Rne/Rng family ribonuclease, partial [Streptomyces sp. NPDC022067]|uniref:Rne/Rng family ribonuclease n=1 Tax=Streptomyces sp. NPDC022067 TaxID=3154906 RepID=UPI0033C502B4
MVETAPEAAPPARTRRRATRKATAPAGAPVEAAKSEEAETPAEAEESGAAAEAETVPAAPARTRRRATRKATAPAGPPQAEAADADASSAAAAGGAGDEATAPAAVAADDAPADEAPRTRTRRRATRKATAPAGAPVEAAKSEEAETPAEAEESAAAAEAETVPAAPARTRRRATRKATAPAGPPQAEAAEEPVTEESVAEKPVAAESVAEESVAGQRSESAEETAGTEAVEAPRARTRRRAARSAAPAAEEPAAAPEPQPVETPAVETPAAEAPAAEAASEAEPEPAPRSRRRAVRPPKAVFQAPVFTEPVFQTPESAAAALREAEEEEDQEQLTAETVEPEAPTSRRRRRRRGGEPVEEHPEAEETGAEAEAESGQPESDQPEGEHGEEESGDRPARRRRRGGRRRRRGEAAEAEGAEGRPEAETGERYEDEPAAEGESAEEQGEDQDEAAGPGAGELGGTTSASSRRRRRRRRRSGEAVDVETSGDDPERTVVKVREPRERRGKEAESGADEVQSIKGSTRLEAKKQRRREGREQGRRRVPIITEAEFLARREAVERVMVVRQHGDRTQIGVLEDNVLVEHFVNKEQATSYVGNVYLGKVQNVLPSMEAAFVDIGKGRNAVLYAGEVNFEALGLAGGPRRIETALKSGQSVLVQVTKDPIGHKGARLTSQVSLPGRYLVYVPEGSMTGISRKLPDTERARLKQILKKIVPEDAGVIVRTAAEGASEEELSRDVARLQAQWEEIQKKAKSGGAPSLLYGEPDMTVRVVRDIFNEDFSKVIVSGDDAWQTIHGYVSHVAPDLVDRLQKWTSDVDVFATYRIDEQLMKALDRKVWLPSGGSLVIDRTEAMVVIDVNTGKFTGQGGNLEETVTRNNLEAAEEIVRQLRLRDLGGIIVIDFIDMVLESNRDLVLRRLLECLGRDRTKHQVAEVTSLGLVQMTRKRVGQGLLESFSESCVHCNGRGVIVHMDQPSAAGGGKRKKKKAAAGTGQQPAEPEQAAVAEAEDVTEAAAEIAAEATQPKPLPEPVFAADEELYSSAAEAEAAATRGRTRRRATRKVTAPAGALRPPGGLR